jgi:alkanesulfonate monooxygenase SsuD/methylene tetrahydromethanopterin reductase-like flavin-dependent oxidoreductase (luciferase family)
VLLSAIAAVTQRIRLAAGAHYSLRDVYFEPKAFRAFGPALWLGGAGMHRRMTQRIVRYGAGFNPLGRPGEAEMRRLREAMRAAGRDMATLELVGGTRAVFPDRHRQADLGQALSVIEPPLGGGFTTFCIKPS